MTRLEDYKGMEIAGPPVTGQSFKFVDVLTDPSSLAPKKPKDYTVENIDMRKIFQSAYTTMRRDAQIDPESSQEEIDVTTVPKEVLDAKLELLDVKLGARIQQVVDAMEARDKLYDERLANQVVLVNERMQGISAKFDEIQVGMKAVKTNIWFGVATTITVVAATLAIAISSFDSGRETSKSLSETTARLEKISAQLDAAAKAQTQGQAAPPATKP